MNKYLLSALALTLSASLQANEQRYINEHLHDQRIQTETIVTTPKINALPQSQAKPNQTEGKTLSISKEELVQHPDLVIRALLPAVMQGNLENVALLFPIYQQIPSQFQDPILTQWAKAILAKKQHNYRKAIRLYREILSAQSDILPARLQLAVSLFENNELDAAEDQFKRLRAEQLIPDVQAMIGQYLAAIERRDRWTFGGGVTYLNDPNINNAPKRNLIEWTTRDASGNERKESLKGSSPEKGEGFSFNFNVGKKWSWGNGFFNELRLNSYGKYYWNNKKYNDLTLRVQLGTGFQNSKFNLTLLPFMEHMLYAGGSSGNNTLKRFSKSGGGSLELGYWLSPKWQLNGNYEYGEQRYRTRKHLNGNYHFVSIGANYLASAGQYWFSSMNYNRTSTKDKSDSFFRRGLTVGWGQEWGKGLSTRLSLGIAQKRYKGITPIFGLQKNRELTTQLSVWHRAVHLWGITPRMTYTFTKVKSNHIFTTYDKHRVFVDFSKQF
ncbi:MAG: porin family protein [Pasteurellaceae bacterium]|nr:porin family protein [Pasteurellaceae bacterium]